MRIQILTTVFGLLLMVLSSGCQVSLSAAADETSEETKDATDVSGTLFGSDVAFDSAKYDGQLAISQGGDWAWNPSLLIFLFLDEDGVPAGQTMRVSSKQADFRNPIPHVHCRSNNMDGKLETEVVMSDYDMTITFGEVDNGHLPGEIKFSIPGQNTKLSGTFRAAIAD